MGKEKDVDYLNDDVSAFREQCLILCDELVEAEKVTPEDLFFVFGLFENYYKSLDNEYFSSKTVDLAWELARLTENEYRESDLGWISYWSIIDGFYNVVLKDFADIPMNTVKENTELLEVNSDHKNDGGKLDNAMSAITELQQKYILIDNEGEIAENKDENVNMERERQISMIFSHAASRYAHYFPYDMDESYATAEFNDWFFEVREEDEYTDEELFEALRRVKEWAELKAKREHSELTF